MIGRTLALATLVFGAIVADGCARGPRPQDQVLEMYQPGSERSAILSKLENPEPIMEAERPPDGWSGLPHDEGNIGRFAIACENRRNVQVESVIVVTTWRYSSYSTMMPAGIYWDYLFFDKDDRLIEYRRRFLD